MDHPGLATACAESIAFLHLLHVVPDQPSANPIPEALLHRTQDYILPLERERSLAGVLAFLACIKADSDRIPALCVRENQEDERLEVIIAVNAKNELGGVQRRTDMLQSLESVFGTIDASVKGKQPLQYQDPDDELNGVGGSDGLIFSQIISVCSQRVLERMRLAKMHARRERQPLKTTLQTAITFLAARPPITFRERARSLITAIDQWTGHQTLEELETIVERVYDLSQVEGLQGLIDSIPDRSLERTLKTSLLNIIVKVSRYREAARVIYRAAKKFPIARRLVVLPVSLTDAMFRKSQPLPPTSLAAVLTRIRGGSSTIASKKARKTVKEVCGILDKTEEQANAAFVALRDKILTEAKIHAEVQILYHCDTHALQPRPRIICSNKDACYLCNALIQAHGKAYTPKCHGRLYPGWCLPEPIAHLVGVADFVKKLEKQVQDSLMLMLQHRERRTYPPPNESTVLTIPYSQSTEADSASSETITAPTSQRDLLDSMHDEEMDQRTEGVDQVEERTTAVMDDEKGSIKRSSHSLVQGETVAAKLKANDEAQMFKAWPVSLQVEYTVGPRGPLGGGDVETAAFECSLTYLNEADADRVRHAENLKIIDGEAVMEEIELDPKDLANLYISVGQAMLQIRQV